MDVPVTASRGTSHRDSISTVREVIYIPEDPEPAPSVVADSTAPNFRVPPDVKPGGSLAIRAIRSMKSLARMASRAALTGDGDVCVKNVKGREKKTREAKDGVNVNEDDKGMVKKESKGSKQREEERGKQKEKERQKPKEKHHQKSDEKDRQKPKAKEDKPKSKDKARGKLHEDARIPPVPTTAVSLDGNQEPIKTLKKRKSSILGLGLGLPSSMRLPTVRPGSARASVAPATQTTDQIVPLLGTADSAKLPSARSSECEGLAKVSTGSGTSGGMSVRWDEVGLERRRKEREDRRRSTELNKNETKEIARSSNDRRRSVTPEAESSTVAIQEGARAASATAGKARSKSRPLSEPVYEKRRSTAAREGATGEFSWAWSYIINEFERRDHVLARRCHK